MDGKMARIRNCTKNENLYIISIRIVFSVPYNSPFGQNFNFENTPRRVKDFEIVHVCQGQYVKVVVPNFFPIR